MAKKTSASDSTAHLLAEIAPEYSIALLQALHIVTRDGRLNQDSRRKLKQVNHLLQFMLPLLRAQLEQQPDTVVVDHGAGKSYLGFMLYDLALKNLQQGRVISVETRAELIQQSQQLAQNCGFTRMDFLHLSAAEAATDTRIPDKIAMVTALHACDTATDDAIDFALAKQAQHVVLVPCCQAEVARALNATKAQSLGRTPLAELWRHPIHTREFGSHLTNVLRCLRLEAHGYKVTVTELVGWEHAMKNELIVATYIGQKKNSAATRLVHILETFHLESLQSRFKLN